MTLTPTSCERPLDYGTPLDPAKAPPKPKSPATPERQAGRVLTQVPTILPRTEKQAPTLVPLTLDATRPASNLPAGVMPRVVNWTVAPEGLRPRLGLTLVGSSDVSSAHSLLRASAYGYLHAYQDVHLSSSLSGVSPQATILAFSGGTGASNSTAVYWTGSYWSALTNNGGALLPTITPTDSITVYDPVADLNSVVWTYGVNALSPYIWRGPNALSGATFYSQISGSVTTGAYAVGYFDTRLVFANLVSGSTRIPQRVTWSERGSLETFVEPTGGTEDLVSMRGGIVKIVDDTDRMILIGEQEIWAGYRAAFPFDFQFIPLDRTMGSGDARTVVRTPLGIMFQGYDFNIYLLPKGSSSLVAVGAPVYQAILTQQSGQLSRAYYSFAVYDAVRQEYVVYPAAYTPAGVEVQPTLGFAFNIRSQAWSTRSSTQSLGHGVLQPVDRPTEGIGPTVWYMTSAHTIARGQEAWPDIRSRTSASTMDLTSSFSASAFLPIGNPSPQRKLYVRDLLIDYSNASCPSGSSITIALSSDFGQTIDKSIGVALPFTQYSRQTIVNVDYSAIYPSVDVQYQSQVSGHFLRIQKLVALLEDVGQPGVGSA